MAHNLVELSQIERIEVGVPCRKGSEVVVAVESISTRNGVAVEVEATPYEESVTGLSIGNSLQLGSVGNGYHRVPS